MAKLSTKLFDIIRNLKADAVPRAPRSDDRTPDEQSNENVDENINEQTSENIFIEPDELKKEKKKSKFKKTFFKPSKDDDYESTNKEKSNKRSSSSNSNVNTQASGNVINIVNSPDFHWGNNFVYHLGTNKRTKEDNNSETEDENITKCNMIQLLMEAKIKPEHDYIDYVSKNLGKNWRSFFRSIGYTKGRIETVEIDEAKNGVSEARYKLLLDWCRNDDDGTLGCLATLLWDEGERQIVKELALIYKKNRK